MIQVDPLTDEELEALGELLLDRVDESRLVKRFAATRE